jgi:hypothetical protein
VEFFSAPEEVLSDMGKHFVSELFALYVEQVKATAKFSPTYTAHPNLVERPNQTLIHSLRNFVNEHHTDWDLYTEACVSGYNKRYHDSLKTSPHEVVFGYKPRLPQFTDVTKPRHKLAKTHFRNLDMLRSTAKSNLQKATKRSTDQANLKRKVPPRYYPDEFVLILRPRKPKKDSKLTKKLIPHYTKPYKIVKRLSDLIYTAVPMDNPTGKIEVIHVSKMKRYFPRQVNCIKTINPITQETITFDTGNQAIQDFPVHAIFMATEIIMKQIAKTCGIEKIIKNNIYDIPYDIINKCNLLWKRNTKLFDELYNKQQAQAAR